MHQHGWEVPKVPCGGRVARAVRVGEGLSALLTLLIWANEEREWQGARARARIIRSSASYACRRSDTTQEAQRAGLDGHRVASWEGSEGSREEGERERAAPRGARTQGNAWNGVRQGCRRAWTRAATRGRTWAATRRRGHRERRHRHGLVPGKPNRGFFRVGGHAREE